MNNFLIKIRKLYMISHLSSSQVKNVLNRSFIGIAFTGLFLGFSALSLAQTDGERLLKESRCYSCHQMTETLLGPPYQAIAQRHASRRDVMVDVLAGKIIRGGGGNWGLIPMVPNESLSLEEARVIVRWILSQAQ